MFDSRSILPAPKRGPASNRVRQTQCRRWLIVAATGVAAFAGSSIALAEAVERILGPIPVSSSQLHTQQTPIAVRDGRVFVADIVIGPSGEDGEGTTDLVTVVRRGTQRADGTWRWGEETLETRTVHDDYHTAPGIGVDETGRVHVAYNMHNFPWQYAAGVTPNAINDLQFRGQPITQAELDRHVFENRTDFPTLGSADIPGNQVTYPAFYNDPAGRLYVTYRFAERPKRDFADRRYASGVARFDTATDSWEALGGPISSARDRDFDGVNADRDRVRSMASQSGWTSYQPRLAFDADGTMNLSFFWRRGTAGATTGRVCAITSENGIDWTTHDGTPVQLPMRPGHCGNVATAQADAYYSISDVAASPGGVFHLLTSPVGESRRIHRWTGSAWLAEGSPSGAREILFDAAGNLWAFGSYADVHVKRAGASSWDRVHGDAQGNDCSPRAVLDDDGVTAFLHTYACTGQPSVSVLRLELDTLLDEDREPPAGGGFDELVLPRLAWTQFTLPFDAAGHTPRTVFADAIGGAYEDEWLIYGFDAASEAFVTLALDDDFVTGVGYWVVHDMPGTVRVPAPPGAVANAATSDARCVAASCLPSDIGEGPGAVVWSLAGYPGESATDLADLRVASTQGPCADGCTLGTAFDRGQTSPVLYRFDPAADRYELLDETGTLDSWDGFWVGAAPTVEGDVELLFPAE